MNKKKKDIRNNFKSEVIKRDNFKCKCCPETKSLTVHHIQDRNDILNGGYVKENGISLCEECHLKAEQYHINDGVEWIDGFHPDDLYKLINSSYELAYEKSLNL